MSRGGNAHKLVSWDPQAQLVAFTVTGMNQEEFREHSVCFGASLTLLGGEHLNQDWS